MKKDIFNPPESEQSPFKPGTASVDEEVVMDSRPRSGRGQALRGNDRGGTGICLICSWKDFPRGPRGPRG